MGAIDAEKYKLHPPKDGDDLSSYRYRQLIGWLGFALAPAVVLVAGLRPHDEASRWHWLGSISAFYYSGATTVFIGAMCAVAFFLIGYRGYKNSNGPLDRIVALVAAASALGAVYFPTRVPIGYPAYGWWTDPMEWVHLGCGIVLFICFAIYSLVLFPQTKPGKNETADEKKWKGIRNGLYRFFGAIILLSLVWAAYEVWNKRPIFLAETVGLEAFAISWLVKGRADVTAVGLVRRTAHYVRHPRKWVVDANNVVRRQKGQDNLPS